MPKMSLGGCNRHQRCRRMALRVARQAHETRLDSTRAAIVTLECTAFPMEFTVQSSTFAKDRGQIVT